MIIFLSKHRSDNTDKSLCLKFKHYVNAPIFYYFFFSQNIEATKPTRASKHRNWEGVRFSFVNKLNLYNFEKISILNFDFFSSKISGKMSKSL